MSDAAPLRPRAVLDPGVLVSSFISAIGAPAALLDAWLDGTFVLVVSHKLLTELEGVLRRPKFRTQVTDIRLRAFLALLRLNADNVDDPPTQPGLTPDPKDDYLAVLALSAATHLVTGDKELQRWRPSDVVVLTPRAFLDELSGQ